MVLAGTGREVLRERLVRGLLRLHGDAAGVVLEYQFGRLLAEQARVAHLAAVEQHAKKLAVVTGGPVQAAITGDVRADCRGHWPLDEFSVGPSGVDAHDP